MKKPTGMELIDDNLLKVEGGPYHMDKKERAKKGRDKKKGVGAM